MRDDMRIVIERDLDGWVISDDEGEFARAADTELVIGYVRALLHGPGTGPKALLAELGQDYDA